MCNVLSKPVNNLDFSSFIAINTVTVMFEFFFMKYDRFAFKLYAFQVLL